MTTALSMVVTKALYDKRFPTFTFFFSLFFSFLSFPIGLEGYEYFKAHMHANICMKYINEPLWIKLADRIGS
ncbi:hypothetical protein HOY80DRAFT_992878 [Tuber brumale]|nr:hypothetical protein HOY80DRAFT_992878 [Tuber brumale]